MRAPSGLKENQSRCVRIRNIQLGTRCILDVGRRLESAELVVGQNKQDHERDRSCDGSNHYSEATFARRRATLRSWLCHERFCFWIWFHATSSLWRSGSNGRGTTANHWLRNLRTGRPATTTGDFEVGIHCVPLVNRILVSHAGIASRTQRNQIIQNGGTSARLGNVVSHVKVKYGNPVLTPNGHTFVVKCGSAMANPHLLTQGLRDFLLH